MPTPGPFARFACDTLLLAGIAAVLVWRPVPFAQNRPLTGPEIAALQDEAAVMRRAGNWEKARTALFKLHQSSPESHIYIAQLAEAYGQLGLFGKESEMWEQFLDHSPLPIEGCPQLGQSYEKQSRWKEARASYERCLALDTTNLDSTFYLAHFCEQHGDLEKAESLYRQGMDNSRDYSDFGIGLARIRLRQGEPAQALRLVQRLFPGEVHHTDALLVLGLASLRTGDRPAARRYLEQGARSSRDPDFPLALARLAEGDGDLDGALRHYQAAAALQGPGSEAATRLALLRKGRP